MAVSYRRWAVILWSIILAAISARALIAPNSSTLYPTFSNAGRQWIAEKSAYFVTGIGIDRYRYSPPVTAFFALCSLMSDRLGGVVWRGLSFIVFFAGLAALSRWWRPRLSLAAMSLLVIPLAIGGLNNGQANAIATGMLLLAAVAFAGERRNLAAALLAVPVMLKAYPLALGLLFCVAEPRRFAPRLVICLFIATAVPYLTQRANYVTAEYTTFVKVLYVDDRTELGPAGYRDLQSLACNVGLPMSLRTYRLLETALGLGCAAVVMAGRWRGWDRQTTIAACLSLSLCWMTVAGPATESCTYVLISPVLAMSMLTVVDRPPWQRWLVRASFVLFTVGAFVVWFPPSIYGSVQNAGIQPFAGLLLTAHVIAECWRSFRYAESIYSDHFLSVFGKSASSSRTAA